jgi:hypothetical protein
MELFLNKYHGKERPIYPNIGDGIIVRLFKKHFQIDAFEIIHALC